MSHLNINKDCPIIFNESHSNRTVFFKDTDSGELYLENKKKFGPSWYYYETPIEYNYNSWGYRTKEFEELLDDYILVMGCSFTEGVGLYQQDMWATKLGKELGKDVFNLGMGATGPDFMMYNTILLHNFLLKTKKLPSMVVNQWSFKHRTSYMFNQGQNKLNVELFSATYPTELYPKNSKFYGEWYFKSYLEDGGEKIKNSNFSIMLCNNLWKSLNIPVFNWTWGEDFDMEGSEFFNNNVELLSLDDDTKITGRDLSHNGHLSQDLVVNTILKKYRYGIS